MLLYIVTAHNLVDLNSAELLQECLKSFDFVRLKELERSIDGTFEWIWSDDHFNEWLSTDCGILWIQGKPGSGKSTLMQYLYRMESNKERLVPTIICEFSFFGQTMGAENSMTGLLRSLIHQIIQQRSSLAGPAMEEFRKEFRKQSATGKGPHYDVATLQGILAATLDQAEQETDGLQFVFFIDSLDECADQSEPWFEGWKFFVNKVAKVHPNSNRKQGSAF